MRLALGLIAVSIILIGPASAQVSVVPSAPLFDTFPGGDTDLPTYLNAPAPRVPPVPGQLGAFCETALGRFGPGALAHFGARCRAQTSAGLLPGVVVP